MSNAHRRNSIGNSALSQRVLSNAQSNGSVFASDTVLNVHHYNSAQDQASGMTSSSNQNSQIIRVRSNSGSTYDVHTHQQGSYHSRTTN
ncbi:hypothetical protein [Thalassomonas actiniarum]|uniref:Uncharacterized protein n=1 Tax=Thalassomonas actiniarum TaxID=485447 RepID=A0AAE9YWJ1_9GAMM|nr:hypothetical protein [Thalassomonas actiniarum]WDE01674.1 hypothetical protein SG35_014215 [Thalassomonas actiniarum]